MIIGRATLVLEDRGFNGLGVEIIQVLDAKGTRVKVAVEGGSSVVGGFGI